MCGHGVGWIGAGYYKYIAKFINEVFIFWIYNILTKILKHHNYLLDKNSNSQIALFLIL